MVKKMRIWGVLVGVLLLAGTAQAMVDLNEEFLAAPEQESLGIVTESAQLSESQKKAIQGALSKMFGDQIASTKVYGEIIAALASALASPEVEQSSKRFVQGLRDLIKVFFKNVKLSDEQLAKMRDTLETLKALALLQMTHSDPQSMDDTVRAQMVALQERLSGHMLPMSMGVQSMLSQEMINVYQKTIAQLLLDLIKDALAILPAGSNLPGAGDPPQLAEPVVPERMIIMQEESEE